MLHVELACQTLWSMSKLEFDRLKHEEIMRVRGKGGASRTKTTNASHFWVTKLHILGRPLDIRDTSIELHFQPKSENLWASEEFKWFLKRKVLLFSLYYIPISLKKRLCDCRLIQKLANLLTFEERVIELAGIRIQSFPWNISIGSNTYKKMKWNTLALSFSTLNVILFHSESKEECK